MNYNENDTVASGLVKPKTTAIFFDKLWLPSYSSVFINDVPDEILLMDNKEWKLFDENDFFSRTYWIGIVDNLGLDQYGTTLSRIYDNIDFSEIEQGDELMPNQFLTSSFRNAALIKISKMLMEKFNIDMVPIYINKTEFEKSLAHINDSPFINHHTTSDELIEQKNNVLEICIKNIPYPVENNLTWEQVLEIRKDDKSVNSIRRLKNMLNKELVGKPEREIKELVDEAIDNHVFALKKHGLMTFVGGMTTILSAAPTIINAVSADPIDIVSVGFAVSAGIITFTAQQISDFITTKRQPIAFLHELNKLNK